MGVEQGIWSILPILQMKKLRPRITQPEDEDARVGTQSWYVLNCILSGHRWSFGCTLSFVHEMFTVHKPWAGHQYLIHPPAPSNTECHLQYPGLYLNTSHDRELSTSRRMCLILSLADSQCFFSLYGAQYPLALVPSPASMWSLASQKLFTDLKAGFSAPWPVLLQDSPQLL